jgi:succinate dehydrogenase hydrophobic anchor subunit
MAMSWWISAQRRSYSSRNTVEDKFMMTRLFGLLILAILFFVLLYYIPIVFIWSINTLFQTTIATTWTNWFAALVLLMLVGNGSGVSYKKKVKKEGCCKEQQEGCCKNQ